MASLLSFPALPPTLADFVIGENDELIQTVRALVAGHYAESLVYIWGDSGSGKSALLQAAVLDARHSGVATYYMSGGMREDSEAAEVADSGKSDSKPSHVRRPSPAVGASTPLGMPPPLPGVLAIDDVDRLEAAAQTTLLDWHYRATHGSGSYLLLASSLSPAELPLFEELRSRLAAGLVFRLRTLSDTEKRRALVAWAARRGFALPENTAALLLTRLPRNMKSLTAALADLDSFLLTERKPLTLRRVQKWLKRRMEALMPLLPPA